MGTLISQIQRIYTDLVGHFVRKESIEENRELIFQTDILESSDSQNGDD